MQAFINRNTAHQRQVKQMKTGSGVSSLWLSGRSVPQQAVPQRLPCLALSFHAVPYLAWPCCASSCCAVPCCAVPLCFTISHSLYQREREINTDAGACSTARYCLGAVNMGVLSCPSQSCLLLYGPYCICLCPAPPEPPVHPGAIQPPCSPLAIAGTSGQVCNVSSEHLLPLPAVKRAPWSVYASRTTAQSTVATVSVTGMRKV